MSHARQDPPTAAAQASSGEELRVGVLPQLLELQNQPFCVLQKWGGVGRMEDVDDLLPHPSVAFSFLSQVFCRQGKHSIIRLGPIYADESA